MPYFQSSRNRGRHKIFDLFNGLTRTQAIAQITGGNSHRFPAQHRAAKGWRELRHPGFRFATPVGTGHYHKSDRLRKRRRFAPFRKRGHMIRANEIK